MQRLTRMDSETALTALGCVAFVGLLLAPAAQAETSRQVTWTTVGTSFHSSVDRDEVWPPASFTVAEGGGTFGPASVQMMSGPVEVPVENCAKGAIKEYDLQANTAVRTFRDGLDQVYIKAVSGLGCIFPDGSVKSESRNIVMGGTGRFENAKGEFTTKVAPQSVSFPEWNGEVNSLIALTEGTITLQHEASSAESDDLSEFERLWNAQDVEALAALYTYDSVTLEARSGERLDLDAFRASLPELTKIQTRVEPVYRVEVGDFALERTLWTSTIQGKSGAQTFESDSHVVSRRQPDGRWLILIDDPGVQEIAESDRGDVSAYQQLWNTQDVEALAALYSYDSVTLQAGGKRLNLNELRAALPELTKTKTQGEPIYRIEVGDIALEKSRWTSKISRLIGSRTVESDSFVVSRRQPDGRWLIVIDDPGFQ